MSRRQHYDHRNRGAATPYGGPVAVGYPGFAPLPQDGGDGSDDAFDAGDDGAAGATTAAVLSQAAQASQGNGDHPAVTAALVNGAAKAQGAPPAVPPPVGPKDAAALANAANASASKGDHPAVTATLADASAKAAAAAPGGPPAPNTAAAVLTQAAKASQGDHPAVTAALVNSAAQAQGAPPPMPPPVGPQDAAALAQAAQASKKLGDHPVITAALTTAAQSASASGAQVAQVLTHASQSAASQDDHPAVTAALSNGAAKAMGAPAVAPPPKGPDAALALANAASMSASKGDHPVVTATLADAAAKASSPTVAAILAQAASGPDMAIHPGAAQALAKAAVANAPPPPGTLPSYANLPGAPSAPPIPKAPPPMPPAATAEGSPPSPPAAPPPPPPALAAIPPAQATAIEASTLATLTPKEGVALQPGETLESGHFIPSHGQGKHGGPRHKLVMQHDGNLVLYHDMTPIWASHTGGTGARRAHMRADGHFVLEGDRGQVIWASGARAPGSFAVLQDDGNFVQYHGNRALWASHQDARSKSRDMRRVGNVFLGGARHYGHRGGSSFGQESVRDERVFRKLAAHMRNAINERHRRGLDLSLETSTGMYTPEEVKFAVSRLGDDDRAGYAAGTALKIGLAHPQFGQHVRTHFHGDLDEEDDDVGSDMGAEWRPWMWFRRRRGSYGPGMPPVILPLAGPAAAPTPLPDGSVSDAAMPDEDIASSFVLPNGQQILPPQPFSDWGSRRAWEQQLRQQWVQQHPGGRWVDHQLGLTAAFLLPDGTQVPPPPFATWDQRRRWEAEQRRQWRAQRGLPPGVMPPPMPTADGDIAAPFLLPDGTQMQVPQFRDWNERHRWEADQHRQWGQRHPERVDVRRERPMVTQSGQAIMNQPVSPFVPPPPPGVPQAPTMSAPTFVPLPHPFSASVAFHGPADMRAPHEEIHGDMGAEYSVSEHTQMYPHDDLAGAESQRFGAEHSVSEHMQMYPHDDGPLPVRAPYPNAQFASLADGDMPNFHRAFPGSTGFGWDWRRRHHGARYQQQDPRQQAQQGQPQYAPQGYAPQYGPYAQQQRRERRGRYFAGADAATEATNTAALQAAGAATAIGSTVLGHDSQKKAIAVIMTHPHLRVGALSTGLGSLWHKLVGFFDHLVNPTLSKATIAPDGKGGLVTTLHKGA